MKFGLHAISSLLATLFLIGCEASFDDSHERSVHEDWYRAVDEAAAKRTEFERCKAYPSPPGYAWPEAVIEALCADKWTPAANAKYVRPLIDNGDWATLHEHYAGLLQRHLDGKDPELLLHRSFPQASWRTRAEQDDYSSRWIEAAPDDPYANLLRARLLLKQAWDARGHQYARETPSERMQQTRTLAQQAIRYASRAVATEPRLLPAYSALINGAALTGDRKLAARALQSALDQAPANYYVRETALTYLEPKWGGSIEEMNRLIEEAQQHLQSNPRLILLRSLEAAREGGRYSLLKQHGPALDAYRRALAYGPAFKVVNYAATTAREAGQHFEAAMLFTQLLRFDRDQLWGLTNRGIALQRLGEYPRAMRDYVAAMEVAPADPDPAYRAGLLEHQRQNFDAAERYYVRALELAPDHADAMTNACRMWVHLTLEPRKAKP